VVCGQSALAPDKIRALVNEKGEFTNNPISAGMRYFFSADAQEQLEYEIEAQVRKFKATGLPLDHVNGHLHLHMHPAIFKFLLGHAKEWGIENMRLTRDPFWFNARLAGGNWLYRAAHAGLYNVLSDWAKPVFERQKIGHTGVVFGLLQNARVDEDYISKLLPRLPPGDSELYSHPSLDEFKNEFDALISPKIKSLVQQLGIELIRYQDL
jgi:predicted glycoside hydrolase/deacetylase ChbG (UPF0249 family)